MLQAPRASVAVIFRRGPKDWVEVVRWNTHTDHFERGAWFNGRIDDTQSDLSPDGELLIYFACRFKRETAPGGYTPAFTAVSRPPWITALALWPRDNCWWGGGLFLTRRQVWLNHRPKEAKPHPAHKPRGLRRVVPNPDAGRDTLPIYNRRLTREGWNVRQLEPDIRVRRHRRYAFEITKTGKFLAVEGPSGPVALPPGRVDWLDWDHNGRLVMLIDGTVRVATVSDAGIAEPTLLLDLRADRPARRPAPPEAREW